MDTKRVTPVMEFIRKGLSDSVPERSFDVLAQVHQAAINRSLTTSSGLLRNAEAQQAKV
jgi:hypothetical protein